jgi:hypothetical protein
MLVKILPFSLHKIPLSVEALQRKSCPFSLSYVTTAAYSPEWSKA